MLNMNSPTVQAMMQNVPQGVGNMPVYFGNTPTITTEQTPTTFNSPYPSPKEMLMQSGQQNVYAPTSFAPRNIVGAYNPGYDAAFNGYVNPYMGYGTYGGYYGYNYPLDEETKQTLQMAAFNGLEYKEQMEMESDLYKKMSRTVSKNIGRSEEDTIKCENAFNLYEKYPAPQYYQRDPITPMHVQIKVGDNITADIPSNNTNLYYSNYIRNSAFIDNMKMRDQMIKAEAAKRYEMMYNSASERRMDNVDILDFFNNHAGSLLMEDIQMQLRYQSVTRTGKLYNSDGFKKLLQNNGYKTKSQMSAVDRFVGRYGYMPDGRPVSPGHDPAVSQSFSYDPTTGQYNITAPNFIADRMEKARARFINSIE